MGDLISRVAKALFNSGCLKFGSFRIKSGASSPYYIDLACLLSSPEDLCSLTDAITHETRKLLAVEKIDKIASIELKGALLLASMICSIDLPCTIVRKEEKTYGIRDRTVGATISKGDNILLFDDVISEGLSKLEAIKPLEELGAIVKHLMVVVDREQGGKQGLEELGYELHALTNISELIESLRRSGDVPDSKAVEVFDYVRSRQTFK